MVHIKLLLWAKPMDGFPYHSYSDWYHCIPRMSAFTEWCDLLEPESSGSSVFSLISSTTFSSSHSFPDVSVPCQTCPSQLYHIQSEHRFFTMTDVSSYWTEALVVGFFWEHKAKTAPSHEFTWIHIVRSYEHSRPSGAF